MRDCIRNNLLTCYDIIKTIHNLYIKYGKYIKYTSFASTGNGIDTTYNIYQIKDPKLIICICKTLYFNDYIILPLKIITIFGIWTFIDDPSIIDIHKNIGYIKHYMYELQQIFNFKYIFHGFYDEYYMIFHQMFIITQFNKYKFILPDKINNLKIDLNIHNYDKIKDNFDKFSSHFFNQYPYGPDIINYEFTNFIKLIVNLNKIDDKHKYFKYYISNKNNKEYIETFINSLKKTHYDKKIYKYYKDVYRLIFYYSYYDYLY